MAFAETQHLLVQIDLKGNLEQKLGRAARAIKGFDRATSNTQRSLSKFSGNLQRGVAIGIAATGTALLGVVKAASDYESAFAGVRKTVTATEPELKALSDQFRSLSKEIPISASELARLGEAGGALGVPTDQLKEFVRVTALLGVTTNLTADEAADSLGVLGNVLKLTGAEYSKFASSLVALGNAGASTERDIVAIAERTGAAGALIGVSTEQILGFSSAVASLGIESEAGGTAIQKFFIDSAKAVANGGAALKVFAKTSGVSGKAFKKAFAEDAGGALQDFLEGLGKLPQAKQLAVLEDLGFNDSRITRTLLGLANNTKLVSDQMDVAHKAFKENTALTKEAEQRFNTFDSQVILLKNSLTDIAITVGSKLLPKITPLIKRLSEFLNLSTTQTKIGEFADKLADGFEKFATALGKVDWQPFIDGLKLSADIARKAIDIFKSLPGPLQAALVGGFALNKITGGLGTSIAKDVGGALLNQFAVRGASPANPLWVQQVGGVPGVPGAPVPGAPSLLTKIGLAVGVGGASALANEAGAFGGLKTLDDKSLLDAQTKRIKELTAAGLTLTEAFKQTTKELSNGTLVAAALQGPPIPAGMTPQFGSRGAKADGREDVLNRAQDLRGLNAQLNDGFRQMVAALKGAKGDKAIAAALKTAIDTVLTGQKGNVKNTQLTLAGLRSALKNTNDPQLQRALRSAISQVERKLVGREWIQKQLTAADKILGSSRTTAQKIADLQRIQKAVGEKSAAASRAVAAKIAEAKRAQVYAARATTQAVKDQDMSVTLRNTVNVSTRVSVADQIRARTTFLSYGNIRSGTIAS